MNFLDLPKRPPKPRETGITHVIDRGMGIRAVRDMLETASDYIDIVKLGWGTGYITQNLLDKLKVYSEFNIRVCLGGTLTEAAILQNKLYLLTSELMEHNIKYIEMSTGVLNIGHDDKAGFIVGLKNNFVVLSEVGKKDDSDTNPDKWIAEIQSDLAAGAWKVILEARESGTIGLYNPTGYPREAFIDRIVKEVSLNNLIFEAPKKYQQAWLIKKFGPNVNLGNIAPDDVIPLETLRLGLRADTLKT